MPVEADMIPDYISLVRAEGGGTMTTKSHPEVTSKEPWYKEVIRDV